MKSKNKKAVTIVVNMNCPLNTGIFESAITLIKEGFVFPAEVSVTSRFEKTNRLTQLFPK
jgi:hypothetical protein